MPATASMFRPAAFAAAVTALPGVAGAATVLETVGRGVQIYTCTDTGGTYGWQLEAPDAVLTVNGQPVGKHFAGPSWQAADGSTVVGEPIASGGGDPAAIPWLILRAKSHAGAGVFAGVAYVVRSRTVGGLAPSTGCDAAHAGAHARVEYSASYTFFPG